MSKGLTEKRRAAILELREIKAYTITPIPRSISTFTKALDFSGLALWCQRNLPPSTQLNRICDDLWAG
jgi:hypothetical protein